MTPKQWGWCKHCGCAISVVGNSHQERCPILVPCPHCGATPGVGCVTATSGKPLATRNGHNDADKVFHNERHHMARPARYVEPAHP